jgi:hypothetical protein
MLASWPRRVRVPALHLLFSTLVAIVAATLVFFLWYPCPFDALAGGIGLFGLLVSVDVVMGPMLSAVAASPKKPRRELRRDLLVIVILQLAAFTYGMQTIARARPVYLSFEVDRFRVVTAADIESKGLEDAPAPLRSLPWLGPKLIAAVKPTDAAEQARSIELGLAGFDLSMVPKYWREFSTQRDAAWKAARPVDQLLAKYPQQANAAHDLAARSGQDLKSLRFLPLMSRRASWSALIAAPDARIVGYLPVEGFI